MSEFTPQPETLPADVPADDPPDATPGHASGKATSVPPPETMSHPEWAKPAGGWEGVSAAAYIPTSLPEDEQASMRSFIRAMERDGFGELNDYLGEYVIVDGDEIIAHGRNLSKIWRRAARVAATRGVSPARYSNYFVGP